MSDRNASARESLSAMADGEASATEVAQACAVWRTDPESRALWHEYQLIGDVMRSQDLAGARSSEAFLQSFRGRLAQEPVVLAPAAASRRVHQAAPTKVLKPLQRRTWTGPIAVAASFVAVVAALLGNQVGPAVSGERLMGAATEQTGNTLALGLNEPRVASLADQPSFDRPASAAPVLVRDPRLDQALATMPTAVRSAPDLSFSNAGALAQTVSFESH